MNPKAIVDTWSEGKVKDLLACELLIGCVEERTVQEIVSLFPENFKSVFRKYITGCPFEDIYVTNLDGYIVKKEWIGKFKSYYERNDV